MFYHNFKSFLMSIEKKKTELQRDSNAIYKWAEECRMEFNGNKFEQMRHGKTAYITSEGKDRG